MLQHRAVPTFALVVIAGLVLTLGWPREAPAGDRLDPEQIKATLHTSSPEEEGFIDRAVALANDGTLPRAIFDSSYLWARKKPRHKFQYFKRALIVRAAEAGVPLE